LIEAKYLRVGLADKADEKKYAPDKTPKATNEKRRKIFLRHLHGLVCRRGINLPQAKVK
jgi:hypothetical protein